MEYADFEGVIPGGEYGGGDVIVWDRGTWTPIATAIRRDGDRRRRAALRPRTARSSRAGSCSCVAAAPDRSGKEQWLLLHKRDEFGAARMGSRGPPHVGEERAARTTRSPPQPDAIWRSDLPAAEAEEPVVRKHARAVHAARPGPAITAAPPPWKAPDGDRAGRPRRARQGGRRGRSRAAELRLTNLDKVLFPAGDRRRPRSPSATSSATTPRWRR